MRWFARLHGKHLLEDCKDGRQGARAQAAQSLRQPLPINCPQLVKGDNPSPVLEATRDAPWVDMAPGCHRCDKNRSQMVVQLIGRDHKTGTRFLYLAAACRIELDKVDLAP